MDMLIHSGNFSERPSVFASSVAWLEGTLLGSVAITVAVIAVASVGFLMLTGRIDVRRAARVIVGCFLIFGAATVAHGIQGAVWSSGAPPAVALPPPPPPVASAPPKQGAAFDPYAFPSDTFFDRSSAAGGNATRPGDK